MHLLLLLKIKYGYKYNVIRWNYWNFYTYGHLTLMHTHKNQKIKYALSRQFIIIFELLLMLIIFIFKKVNRHFELILKLTWNFYQDPIIGNFDKMINVITNSKSITNSYMILGFICNKLFVIEFTIQSFIINKSNMSISQKFDYNKG